MFSCTVRFISASRVRISPETRRAAEAYLTSETTRMGATSAGMMSMKALSRAKNTLVMMRTKKPSPMFKSTVLNISLKVMMSEESVVRSSPVL